MSEETVLYESKWLGLYRRGHWDYVRRPNSDCCVGVLAITEDDEVLLVEQFRVPMGKTVIEIPAGLVGDEPEFKGEALSESAGRELLEETGYRAGRIELLISSPTSAGMTPEIDPPIPRLRADARRPMAAGRNPRTSRCIMCRFPARGISFPRNRRRGCWWISRSTRRWRRRGLFSESQAGTASPSRPYLAPVDTGWERAGKNSRQIWTFRKNVPACQSALMASMMRSVSAW